MAYQTTATAELLSYVRASSLRDDLVLRELREVTAGLPAGEAMQVMAEEGQLLGLLVGLTGARAVLEIGTFTGYSTLCMARALPADGRLVTCDLDERWPGIGAGYWRRAGVGDRDGLRIGAYRFAARGTPAGLGKIGVLLRPEALRAGDDGIAAI